LFWCSIESGEIRALTPTSGLRECWHFDDTVGSFGLCESGRLIVALRKDVVLFDMTTRETEHLTAIDHRHGMMRLTDGKVGPDGAF